MNDDIVPLDFPVCQPTSAIAGAQPKLSAVKHEGRYYTFGNDPTTRRARYLLCNDLVEQFTVVARETKIGKRRDMPESEILAQYRSRLLASGWGIERGEAVWIFEKVAVRLGWPAPPPI